MHGCCPADLAVPVRVDGIAMKERKPKILYFSPEYGNPNNERQILSLTTIGFEVSVTGFRRKSSFTTQSLDRIKNILPLGTAKDEAYAHRAWLLLQGLVKLFSNRAIVRSQDYFYAHHLDMAVLAVIIRRLSRSHARIIYQTIDVRKVLQKQSIAGSVLRLVERIVLSKSDVLVVSSPGFIEHYFKPKQKYDGRWVVIENKLRGDIFSARPAAHKRKSSNESAFNDGRWRIGWFGKLRMTNFNLFCEVAKRLEDTTDFIVAGTAGGLDAGGIRAVLKPYRNITFKGEYAWPHDLFHLYQEIDFIWCLDQRPVDGDGNPTWLLPNRIYEGGYFSVPVLAYKWTQTAQMVEQYNLGWSFYEPLSEALITFVENIKESSYMDKVRHIANMPAKRFVDNGDDYVEMFLNIFSEKRLHYPRDMENP